MHNLAMPILFVLMFKETSYVYCTLHTWKNLGPNSYKLGKYSLTLKTLHFDSRNSNLLQRE